MYIPVDATEDQIIEGYSYTNLDGCEEVVGVSCGKSIVTVGGMFYSVDIYTQDIGKLIMALKAAYKHQTGDEI